MCMEPRGSVLVPLDARYARDYGIINAGKLQIVARRGH